jgi:hypothetical protein
LINLIKGQLNADQAKPKSKRSLTDIERLVELLPADIRQKVRSGKAPVDDSSGESSDEEESAGAVSGWKKKDYWNGDTADLEIGQDAQDAEDEEQAAEVTDILESCRLVIYISFVRFCV